MATVISRPQPDEHDPYYKQYFDLLTDTDLFDALDEQIEWVRESLSDISTEESEKLHDPYTWTLKQVIGHCIDNERVFGYRALRFASGDVTDLPGYDQDIYAERYNYDNVTLSDQIGEFGHIRRANLLMLKRLPERCWDLSGTCDGKNISVRAIAWLLAAHLRHHLCIVRKRIGKN